MQVRHPFHDDARGSVQVTALRPIVSEDMARVSELPAVSSCLSGLTANENHRPRCRCRLIGVKGTSRPYRPKSTRDTERT